LSTFVKPQPAPAAGASMVPSRPAEHRFLRLVRLSLWGLLLLTMAGVVGIKVLAPRQSRLPVFFPAAGFKLVDQDDKAFTSESLHGRPWAGAFIFTSCGSSCPRMTAIMAALQKKLAPQVMLVSFSVDPENDTPAVLKGYAQRFGADESRWRFLTGPKDAIMAVINDMKTPFQPAGETGPIEHSENLLLVDANGQIRGNYVSSDPAEMDRFVTDANALAREAGRGSIGRFLSRINAATETNSAIGPVGRGGTGS
jgi:cytochrome oxidase Cu insertion factor (SCO1/SenC/PrrC family)